MQYIKENVTINEYNLLKKANENNINTPQIIDYNRETQTLIMEKIPYMCIADYYGDDIDDVPDSIIQKIRKIIQDLYSINIEYTDITGYNFIQYNKKVWIIDFGHATEVNGKEKDPFVNKFINGFKSWNPLFS